MFTLTEPDLLTVLRDPQFYTDCPAYFFLRTGIIVAERYASALQQRAAGASIDREMVLAEQSFKLLLSSFVKHTAEMRSVDTVLLDPLREYLLRKLKLPDESLSLFYKGEGTLQELRI